MVFFNIDLLIYCNCLIKALFLTSGVVAQSVESATPGEEVPGSIPAVAATSILVGLVSV